MKIRHIALAAVAVACGQANALTPAQVAATGTVKVYMSGASGMRNVIGALFTENCDGTTLNIYYSAKNNGYGGQTLVKDAKDGDSHRVYTCTMKATSPVLPGKSVALFKSDFGGSGQGIFPVHAASARPFLNLASCGAVTVGTATPVTCTGEQSQVPAAGVSDLEPAMFKGVNVPSGYGYPTDGLSPDQISTDLSVNYLFQTVFGVAVSKNLRDAMQTAQGLTAGDETDAGQPTISRALAASYFSGSLSDPSVGLGWQPLVAGNSTRVNICRRVDGSGTQAASNAVFLQFPCGSSALSLANRDSNAFPGSSAASSDVYTNVGTSGNLFVFEGAGTGDVVNCLTQANTVGAYAIGHVSKENDQTGSAWRHIKLDGVVPHRDNVKKGAYDYYFESTLQWNNTTFAGLSADQQNFLTQFAATAGTPDALAKMASAANKAGVVALPGTSTAAFGTGTTAEVDFVSRVSRGGNSCTPSTYYK